MAITENLKRCSRCHQRRDPSWFSADLSRPDWLARWCKPCSRAAWRERAWGITQEEFDRILQAQQGGCGICGTTLDVDRTIHHEALTRFCVDRADDGSVRGFLCAGCRAGVRGFGSDVDHLRRAIDYLRRTEPRDSDGKEGN